MERYIKILLEKVAKKIAKIEESNPSFKHDKKWLELRARQDNLYDLLAKAKLKKLESSTLNYYREKELKRVKDYLGSKDNGKQNQR